MKQILKRVGRWGKRMAIASATAIVAIGVYHKLTEAPPHQPEETEQIRGVWMTHVGNAFYAATGQLDDVFHQLSRLNFNRVYISVYNDGVIYPSKVSHRNRETRLMLVNSLNRAIHEGDRQGLKVYGWFEYGLMLHAHAPLAQAHPDWLLNEGQEVNGFVWLDPTHPEVEQYFVELFTEFAYLYHKLEGIQLDDHWAVPSQFGNYVEPLNQLTAKVTQTVKEINPHWTVSLSPNAPDFAYRRYSQDWLTWVERGYVDEVIVQLYRPTAEAVETAMPTSGLREASRYRYVPVGVGLFTGFRREDRTLTPLADAAKQIELVRGYGYGYALFTYEYTFSFLRRARTQTKESYFPIQQITSQFF